MNAEDARSLLEPLHIEPTFPSPEDNDYRNVLADPENVSVATVLELLQTCVGLDFTDNKIKAESERASKHAQMAIAQLFTEADDRFGIGRNHSTLLEGMLRLRRECPSESLKAEYLLRYMLTKLPNSTMTQQLRRELQQTANSSSS